MYRPLLALLVLTGCAALTDTECRASNYLLGWDVGHAAFNRRVDHN